MRRALSFATVLALVVAGCGGTADPSSNPEPTATSAPSTTVPSSSLPESTSPVTSPASSPDEATPDLAVFIAAIDELTVGTRYEDAALDEPEVFIGVGQLFCELLTSGESINSVIGEYLVALTDDNGQVADDDALVAGVVMGASLEVLCPEHQVE